MVLLTIINSLLVFDYVYIITRGGPAGASEVVGTLMYKEAFKRFEAGYAAAMALGLSFVSGRDRAGLHLPAPEGVGGLSTARAGRRTRREPSKIPYYVVLVLLALFALGPLVVLAFNSLKASAEIGRNPLGPPISPVFQNFPDA